ncbi:MAG: dephospho-CoA kinase [Myroides sp.]|nr:dephospho-CoA kinase [Myroides sp.]
MTKIIGVTGGIGSGKTTIVNYIHTKGYPVYIADEAGKKVMQQPKVIQQVNALFEGKVLLDDGSLDRSKIASLVFNDEQLLSALNQIVHPAVASDFEEFKKQNSQQPLVFKEAAILFESGSYKDCDATILITAPLNVRIDRVVKRDGISKEAVLQRMKNQLTDEEKQKLATFTVENMELNHAFKSIDEIIDKLLIK